MNETNTIFRFRNFPVYKDARQFREELKQLSKKKFPKEEEYILKPQLWRALDSIILNIAEGADILVVRYRSRTTIKLSSPTTITEKGIS